MTAGLSFEVGRTSHLDLGFEVSHKQTGDLYGGSLERTSRGLKHGIEYRDFEFESNVRELG